MMPNCIPEPKYINLVGDASFLVKQSKHPNYHEYAVNTIDTPRYGLSKLKALINVKKWIIINKKAIQL